MSKLKPTKQVKPLLDEAKAARLDVANRGDTWIVTAPDAGLKPVFIPINTRLSRNLANYRAAIRRLAEAAAARRMPAAAPQGSEEFTMPAGWTTRDLVAYARAEGIDLRVSSGELHITTPPGTEALGAALIHHKTAVITVLREELMPLTEPAAPAAPEPADEFLDNARSVWACMRDDARTQGEKVSAFQGTPGVIWSGARDTVIRTLGPEWSNDYLVSLRTFLSDCGAMHCRKLGRFPIWWLRAEWPTVAALALRAPGARPAIKITYEAAAEPEPAPAITPTPLDFARAVAKPTPTPAAETVDFSNPLEALARIKARITAAEEQAEREAYRADVAEDRADKAEARADKAERLAVEHGDRADKAARLVIDLETQNQSLTDQLETVAPKLAELDQIKGLFRDLAGGPRE